ncbi:MAG: histidine kinase [Oscillospiraceae bacterium]|nr:histidine kinase [Oscillospiraceae bacterium]
MNLLKAVNISIELCGISLCIMGIIAVLIGTKIEKKDSRYFICLFLCLLIDLLSNMSGQIFRGAAGTVGFYAVRISNFSEFFFGYLLTFCVTWYLLYCIDPQWKKKELRVGIGIFYGGQLGLLVLSQFNKMYYYIDSSNVYHRGELFWLSQAVSICSFLLDAVLLVWERASLSKKQKLAFGSYLLLPTAALIGQLFYYGLVLTLIASILGAFVMFLFILNDQVERYCAKERENTNMQTAIMLSQIQPHFLYNVLNTIYYLCGKDPKEAQNVVANFSDYLRGNLDSLNCKEPVPFATELEHVKKYLSLEEARFREELQVVYDIEATGFMVPTLTVQPLVENAVRYGLGKKPGGGTVRIATREEPDRYVITIDDDGVGFDPEHLEFHDNRSHIGISNVRSRLATMCGASLDIQSEIGRGTTAVITVQKKEDRL